MRSDKFLTIAALFVSTYKLKDKFVRTRQIGWFAGKFSQTCFVEI